MAITFAGVGQKWHLWPQVSLVDLINLFVQLMDVELNETGPALGNDN